MTPERQEHAGVPLVRGLCSREWAAGVPAFLFAFSRTKRFWDKTLIFFLISRAPKSWEQALQNVSGRSLGFPGQNYKQFLLFPAVRFPSNESDPCLCTV